MPVTELLAKLYQVLFSGFARVQEDVEHPKLLNQKIMCAMTSLIYPLLLILIFIADGVIYQVYGQKWLLAANALQVMAVGSFSLVISITLGALSHAQGLVGREIPIQAANVVLTIAAVVIGARWGLVWVASGIALKSYLIFVMPARMMAWSHLALNSGRYPRRGLARCPRSCCLRRRRHTGSALGGAALDHHERGVRSGCRCDGRGGLYSLLAGIGVDSPDHVSLRSSLEWFMLRGLRSVKAA